MAICAVCGAPCRGKCGRCGARLCVTHRPPSARAKCAVCKFQAQTRSPAQGSISHIPQVPLRSQTSRSALATLTLADQLAWISDRRIKLCEKRQWEQDYLDRRAARGTRTSTDVLYEQHAVLEYDLLEALDLLAICLQAGSVAPASGSNSVPE